MIRITEVPSIMRLKMKVRKIIQTLVLLIVMSVVNLPLHAQTFNNHDMRILFRNVVFFTDGGAMIPLTRWTSPIVGNMEGGAEYRQRVLSLFAEFSKLTGLPFRLTDNPKKANLRIYFLSKADIWKRNNTQNVNCLGRYSGSKKKGTIIRAEVYISTDSRAKAKHCLVEEIIQILGLPGDINMFEKSIFHDKSTQTSLTVIDKIMLKTLYFPGIKNGMTLADAMPIAKKVILLPVNGLR